MALENSAGIDVLNSYGPRTTNTSFGAQASADIRRITVIDIGKPTTTTTTDAAFGRTGLQASAWAVSGVDTIIPAGATLTKATFVCDAAFDALTGVNIGTYAATDGTTAVDADGIATAANMLLATIDNAAAVYLGNGAQLAAGDVKLTADVVVRALYTGTVPTVGKGRLYIEWFVPTPY